MAVINAIAWPLRLLAVGLVTAGLGSGVYFLAQADNDGDELRVVVAGTATAGASSPTQPPPGVTETPPQATEPPTAPPPTAVPTLPPPPPKPDQPTEVQGGTLVGGQWYEIQECLVVYLPAGYDFLIHLALNDPGGFMTMAFEAEGSASSVAFLMEDATEVGRTVASQDLNPVFDQIAATITREC
jgi:hypothetical protein